MVVTCLLHGCYTALTRLLHGWYTVVTVISQNHIVLVVRGLSALRRGDGGGAGGGGAGGDA
jgi:hypothetical protein